MGEINRTFKPKERISFNKKSYKFYSFHNKWILLNITIFFM